MASSELEELKARSAQLIQQFLPPLNELGFYSDSEQDQMRALRMLVHAEVEVYLENLGLAVLGDLEAALSPAGNFPAVINVWGKIAADNCRINIASNNGVKASDIKKMFSPLGIENLHFERVSFDFLDAMTAFGKQRGDVAHHSALRAQHSLTRQREEAFLRKILDCLSRFDEVIAQHRQTGFRL